MSDADNQMGGNGGDTGKDPAQQTDQAPDPKSGNMGREEREDAGETTGDGQAAANRENDPPA